MAGLKLSQMTPVSDIQDGDRILLSRKINNLWRSFVLPGRILSKLETGGVNRGNGTPIFMDKSGENLRFRTFKSRNVNLAITNDTDEIFLEAKVNGANKGTGNDGEPIFAGKNSQTGTLEFKRINTGRNLRIDDNQNRVLISVPQNFYFFRPARPANPNVHPVLYRNSWSMDNFRNRDFSTGWLRIPVQGAPDNCDLALIRWKVNSNPGGNSQIKAEVRQKSGASESNRISIDSVGGAGPAFEGEEIITTVVQFEPRQNYFEIKIDATVGGTARVGNTFLTTRVVLEGFYC
jgi:hypothetical protein